MQQRNLQSFSLYFGEVSAEFTVRVLTEGFSQILTATAILAEALEIPAVVGTGPFLTGVSGGELAIIDGDQGLVILQPDEKKIAHYRREVEQRRSLAVRLETLRDLPAETVDGARIQLLGNIEFPHEVDHCVDRGADGVGL